MRSGISRRVARIDGLTSLVFDVNTALQGLGSFLSSEESYLTSPGWGAEDRKESRQGAISSIQY